MNGLDIQTMTMYDRSNSDLDHLLKSKMPIHPLPTYSIDDFYLSELVTYNVMWLSIDLDNETEYVTNIQNIANILRSKLSFMATTPAQESVYVKRNTTVLT